MKFILPMSNWFKDWDLTVKAVLKAEEMGFWAIGMPDHYLWGPNRDDATLDSWFALTYLSSMTNRIHLGTIVTPIPFRPPGMLAKMVSTLDLVSNGRVFLGVGAGWSEREFQAYSQWDPPSIRVSKTEEGLRLILALWTENKVDFQGKFYQSKGGVLQPKPVQKPHPPLFFGGFGPKMLTLAGRYGDIVFIPPWIKQSFEEARAMVMEAAEHSPRVDRPSFAAGVPEADHGSRKYDREQISSAVGEMQRAGCEYFVLFLDSSELLEAMEDFGRHVVPSYS